MKATLYQPHHLPQIVPLGGLTLPSQTAGFATIPTVVPSLLNCSPSLVDVLASGPDYTVYTIFDSEGEANPMATQAVVALTGIALDATNEDELLRGPVLIVKE